MEDEKYIISCNLDELDLTKDKLKALGIERSDFIHRSVGNLVIFFLRLSETHYITLRDDGVDIHRNFQLKTC